MFFGNMSLFWRKQTETFFFFCLKTFFPQPWFCLVKLSVLGVQVPFPSCFFVVFSCFWGNLFFVYKPPMLSLICNLQHFLAFEHLKYDEMVPEICIKITTKSELKTNTFFRVIFWNCHNSNTGALFLGGRETQKSKKQRPEMSYLFLLSIFVF